MASEPAGAAPSLGASLKAPLASLRADVRERTRAGESARAVAALHAAGIDAIAHRVHEAARAAAAAAAASSDALDPLALLATGGWGRRELSPYSDLDLLFLVQEGAERGVERRIEQTLYALWDLGLELSHAVRTPADCARLSHEDLRVATSALEARPICDEGGLAASLRDAVRASLLGAGAATFVERLREEQRSRARRFADSVYLLEPDLKGGPGGLRDLNVARWAARASHDADDFATLLHRGAVTPSQARDLEAALEFLLRIRAEMHLLAGRRADRLTFDLQDSVARAVGHEDTPTELAAEQLMRAYYRHARAVAARTSELLARAAESGPRRAPQIVRIDARFYLHRGELVVADPDGREGLLARPSLVLEAFRVAQARAVAIHPHTRERLAEAAPAVGRLCALAPESLDARARAERARVHATFLEILCDPADRAQTLAALHETGVLRAVLPEFAQIECLWRRDLFHVYTVDVHTLHAVECLRALVRGDLAAEQPRLTEIARDGAGPGAAPGAIAALYLGMLLHDVGKLHGTRHSEVGAEMAIEAVRRLGLGETDAETARLLVLHHLLMSHVATKRDFSDASMLAQFTAAVGTLGRLDALYLLTFADVSSVGPGVLSGWSASLLGELYERAREQLLRGAEGGDDVAARVSAARTRLREAAAGEHPALPASVLEDFLQSADDRQILVHGTQDLLAQLRCLAAWAAGAEAGVALHVQDRPSIGVADVTIACADAPGVLAKLAGTLTANGVDILGARIYSAAIGGRHVALDVFHVTDPGGAGAPPADRWPRVRADLADVLSGRVDVAALLVRRRRSSLGAARALPAERHRVSIDNAVSRDYTVVDVHTEDRPGVLFAVADAMHRQGASIALSKIATEAEDVADVFYVTDAAGGGKIADPAHLERLRVALLDAVRRLPWE